jgi:DNA-binding NtrC family response regulator
MPASAASLARGDLKRLIPEKLADILIGLVARHPSLMEEVAGEVLRAQKSSPKAEPEDDSIMVGACPAMKAVFDRIRRFANVAAPVLISGESGTGKELAAKAIHERSSFAKGPFIAINCGGLPENLVASELFGYERGAFTGATERRIGRIEAADGGTLFLDEVGDMPLSLQPQLLRFLQDMTFRRVGGKELIRVRLRVVTATNVNLEQAIRDGHFRKDLYFRLNVLRLELPALRDRKGDMDLIVRYVLRRVSEEHGVVCPRLTDAALDLLQGYDWPGNVRELISAIRRAVILGDGVSLEPRDFIFLHRDDLVIRPLGAVGSGRSAMRQRRPSAEDLRRALAANANNVTRTARHYGVSRVTIYAWLRS